jgi:hypothetical protein
MVDLLIIPLKLGIIPMVALYTVALLHIFL